MEYQSLKLLLAHSGWAFSALLTDGGGGGGGEGRIALAP